MIAIYDTLRGILHLRRSFLGAIMQLQFMCVSACNRTEASLRAVDLHAHGALVSELGAGGRLQLRVDVRRSIRPACLVLHE